MRPAEGMFVLAREGKSPKRMALPQVTAARIDEALAQFDREDRDLPKWKGWEERRSYKHAIVKNGRLYPPKEILALATGLPVSEFSGGPETNDYLVQRGLQIEALRLPTQGQVEAALHDLIISKAPEAIEPTDAYEILADQFKLPERLRSMLLEKSQENAWQNRVRQARRNLVEDGVLDRSEVGQWQVLLRPHPAVWIEKCLVNGRPDRLTGDDALGHALWSPLRFRNGADGYRNMRLVQPEDIILHLTDNEAFTGVSIADGFAHTDFVGLGDTDWAGLQCYRISLRDFRPLEPPLTRDSLFEDTAIRQKLIAIRRVHPNLFYDPDLSLHEGGYLTSAPDELVSLLDTAYHDQTNHYLLGKPIDIKTEKNISRVECIAARLPNGSGFMHLARERSTGMNSETRAWRRLAGITSATLAASIVLKRLRRKWTSFPKNRNLLSTPPNAMTSRVG